MEKFEDLDLEEIYKLNKSEYIKQYFIVLKQLKNNRVSKKIVESLYGKSLATIYQEIMRAVEELKSYLISPGDLIILYPNIKEYKSKNFKTCDFSGAIIHPGSLYISYRPLLENITKKESFVLKKTLHVETGYIYRLPTEIGELETLEQKMILESSDQEINFNHFNNQMGGHLLFQK